MNSIRRIIRILQEETYYIQASVKFRMDPAGHITRNRILVNGSQKSGTIWMVRLITSIPGYRPIGNFLGDIDRYREVRPGDVVHGHDYWSPKLESILRDKSIKVVLTVRDPRDQTVSRMFHIQRVTTTPYHHLVKNLELDQALMMSIEGHSATQNAIEFPSIVDKIDLTNSWLSQDGHAHIIKYEDLVKNPVVEFQKVLEYLEIQCERDLIEAIITRNRFERLSVGRRIWNKPRKPGETDPDSHFRNGIIGDWKNYYKEYHKRRFKQLAGEALIELGYENDLDW